MPSWHLKRHVPRQATPPRSPSRAMTRAQADQALRAAGNPGDLFGYRRRNRRQEEQALGCVEVINFSDDVKLVALRRRGRVCGEIQFSRRIVAGVDADTSELKVRA